MEMFESKVLHCEEMQSGLKRDFFPNFFGKHLLWKR